MESDAIFSTIRDIKGVDPSNRRSSKSRGRFPRRFCFAHKSRSMGRDGSVIGDDRFNRLSGVTSRMIFEDYAALKRGEIVDAFEVLEELRIEHAF